MSIVGERVIADVQLAEAARYLARLAALDGGYVVREVSGWAHSQDVARATGMRMDGHLPRLHEMRLVQRVDLGPGGTTGEYWVYRITEAGARASAQTWGDAYERIRVPGEMEIPKPVYAAPGPRNALEILRAAYEAGGPQRFGDTGWRTGRELTLFLDELNRKHERTGGPLYTRIDSMELTWLVGVGLAEKRNQTVVWGRERPAVFWRVSESGRQAVLVSWRAPRREGTDMPGGELRWSE